MVDQESNETYRDDEGKSENPHYTQHRSHFGYALLSTFDVDWGLLKLLGHVIIFPFMLHNVRPGGNDS
jgi:hypothetical protein